MTRLNYFEPYQAIGAQHENQLTRAFLVILRNSALAQLCFYDLVREAVFREARSRSLEIDLPSVSEVVQETEHVRLATQKGSLDDYEAKKTVSVLLTDENIKKVPEVKADRRNAVYDGIIRYGSLVTCVVEVKPFHGSVREEQFHLRMEDERTTDLLSVPAVVRWRDLIEALQNLAQGREPGLAGAERTLIDDFFQYINANFPSLNPFRRLHYCGQRIESVERRIESLLHEIAATPESITYRTNWGHCIDLELEEVRYAGLVVKLGDDAKEEVKALGVDLYFGDTVGQARALYARDVTYERVKKALTPSWIVCPNFHLSFAGKNLVWLETPDENCGTYIDHWREHQDEIGQYDRGALRAKLTEWVERGIINIDPEAQGRLNEWIWDTDRQVINVCPGFGVQYVIPYKDALVWDKGRTPQENRLAVEVAKRMREALGIVTDRTERFVKAVG